MGRFRSKKKRTQHSNVEPKLDWKDIHYLLAKMFGVTFDKWSEFINYRELDELMGSEALAMELSKLIPQKQQSTSSDADFKKYMNQMGGVF